MEFCRLLELDNTRSDPCLLEQQLSVAVFWWIRGKMLRRGVSNTLRNALQVQKRSAGSAPEKIEVFIDDQSVLVRFFVGTGGFLTTVCLFLLCEGIIHATKLRATKLPHVEE